MHGYVLGMNNFDDSGPIEIRNMVTNFIKSKVTNPNGEFYYRI